MLPWLFLRVRLLLLLRLLLPRLLWSTFELLLQLFLFPPSWAAAAPESVDSGAAALLLESA